MMFLVQYIRRQALNAWTGVAVSLRRAAFLGAALFLSSTSSAAVAREKPSVPDRVEQLDARLKGLQQERKGIWQEFDEKGDFRKLRANRRDMLAISEEKIRLLQDAAKSLKNLCLIARLHGDIAGARYWQQASFDPEKEQESFSTYRTLFRKAEGQRVVSLKNCAEDESATAGERIAAQVALDSAPDYIKASGKFAAVVMDIATGKIVHDEGAHAMRRPASLVKMMVLLLLFDELAKDKSQRKLNLNTRITMVENANRVPPSILNIATGEEITIYQAAEALIVVSANNVAELLALNMGDRDRQAFIGRMNKRAEDLGMAGTHFTNPSGLSDPDGKPHAYTTAADMARLMAEIRKVHPELYKEFFGKTSMQWCGQTIKGHHLLVRRLSFVEAEKTGSTPESGLNDAVSDGDNIVVVMGLRTAEERFMVAEKLLRKYRKAEAQAQPWKKDPQRKTRKPRFAGLQLAKLSQ